MKECNYNGSHRQENLLGFTQGTCVGLIQTYPHLPSIISDTLSVLDTYMHEHENNHTVQLSFQTCHGAGAPLCIH